MLSLLHEEFGPAADAVLAPLRDGAAAADRRDEAPRAAQRRTLPTLLAALAATRRGLGD
jgi:hypothetical protein